jgi:hypothetical protein
VPFKQHIAEERVTLKSLEEYDLLRVVIPYNMVKVHWLIGGTYHHQLKDQSLSQIKKQDSWKAELFLLCVAC